MPNPDRTIETVLTIIADFWAGGSFIWSGLAIIFFAWGMTKVIRAGGNSEQLEEGKRYMIWAIIGVFVIFSIWGLIELLQNTLSLNNAPSTDRLDTLFPDDVTDR